MKKEKKVISPEEKAELKLKKRYTLFRHGKIATIIMIAFVVAGAACFGLGVYRLNNGLTPDQGVDILTILLMCFGWFTSMILPFVIFRRMSLAIILLGVAFWDMGVLIPAVKLEGMGMGGFCLYIGLMIFLLSEFSRNKKKGNKTMSLTEDFLIDALSADDDGTVLNTFDEVSYFETTYKARLYSLLSILFVSATGIGLLLPFGMKAYEYNKACFLMRTEKLEITENPKTKYKEGKPFKDLVNKNEFYLNETCFVCHNNGPYATLASVGWLTGFGYIFISGIIAMCFKQNSILERDEKTAGKVVFSKKELAEKDPQISDFLVAYAKVQSDENRERFMEGLQALAESIEEDSRREGERIARYEAERDRWAQAHATGTSVQTDGKDFYVDAITDSGATKKVKLDNYDRTTGVGTFKDSSGKQVKVKNTNKK